MQLNNKSENSPKNPTKLQVVAGNGNIHRSITLDMRDGIFNSIALHGEPPLSVARRVGITISDLCHILIDSAQRQCKLACQTARLNGQRSMLPVFRQAVAA